jgi:hypothetical protein
VTPRDRRALALGAAVVTAAAALRLVPAAVGRVREARERLGARVELLTRMRADLRDATRLQDSAEVVRHRIAGLAWQVLSPRTEVEAEAGLGALVSMAAERNRVRLGRSEPVPDSASAGPARRVSVRAALESDAAGLLGLLGSLAGGPAVLTIGALSVVADPPSAPAAPELLRTEITVRGWYLPGTAAR